MLNLKKLIKLRNKSYDQNFFKKKEKNFLFEYKFLIEVLLTYQSSLRK